MKKNILFITQPILKDSVCAISMTGNHFADAFMLSQKYNVMKFQPSSGNEMIELYKKYNPEVIFYMFCSRTTQWMMEKEWKKHIHCKNLVLDADVTQKVIQNFSYESFYHFDGLVSLDPNLDVDLYPNVYMVNQIMPQVAVPDYEDTGITKIGFHGSPTINKGILDLPIFVQNEFDEAEIRFHCPLTFPNNGHTPQEFMKNLEAVKSKIYKPGIKFILTTDIISNQELVNRLSQNTINCYLNHDSTVTIASSAIHTALAAKRPIAIRRVKASAAYFNTKPSICLEDNSLRQIIQNGFEPLKDIYEKFSPQNVCKDFENIVSKVLKPSGFSFSL